MSTKKTTGVALLKRKKREESSDKKKRKGRTKIKEALSDKKLRNPKAEYLLLPKEESLPWCLFTKSKNPTTTEYPGTATDFIIRNLLAEFKTLSEQKIFDTLCKQTVGYPK